jgi:hypothetical protein
LQAGIQMEAIIHFSIISIQAPICITGWQLKKMTDKLLIHLLSGFHPIKKDLKYIPHLLIME